MPAATYFATTTGGLTPLRSTTIDDAIEEAKHLNGPDQTVDILDADHNQIATCVDIVESWLPYLPTNSGTLPAVMIYTVRKRFTFPDPDSPSGESTRDDERRFFTYHQAIEWVRKLLRRPGICQPGFRFFLYEAGELALEVWYENGRWLDRGQYA